MTAKRTVIGACRVCKGDLYSGASLRDGRCVECRSEVRCRTCRVYVFAFASRQMRECLDCRAKRIREQVQRERVYGPTAAPTEALPVALRVELVKPDR